MHPVADSESIGHCSGIHEVILLLPRHTVFGAPPDGGTIDSIDAFIGETDSLAHWFGI